MKLNITEKQVRRLAALAGAKAEAEARLNLALAVLADGVGIEKWGDVGLDADKRTLTFVEPDEPVGEPDA